MTTTTAPNLSTTDTPNAAASCAVVDPSDAGLCLRCKGGLYNNNKRCVSECPDDVLPAQDPGDSKYVLPAVCDGVDGTPNFARMAATLHGH